MIFIINNFISNKKILIISFIGKNTLFLYWLHGIIIKILNPYINSILDTQNGIVDISIAIIFTVMIIGRYWNNCVIYKKNNRKDIE